MSASGMRERNVTVVVNDKMLSHAEITFVTMDSKGVETLDTPGTLRRNPLVILMEIMSSAPRAQSKLLHRTVWG